MLHFLKCFYAFNAVLNQNPNGNFMEIYEFILKCVCRGVWMA